MRNRIDVRKWGVTLSVLLGAVASDTATADAGSTTTIVYVPGGVAPVGVIVESATGGTVVPAKTVGPVSTVAMSTPLVVTRGLVESRLLKFGMVDLFYPQSYPHAALKTELYDQKASDAFELTELHTFQEAKVTKVTLPGTYGSTTQRGPFVLTADIANPQSIPPPKGITRLPPVHSDAFMNPQPVWAFELNGFSNGKQPPTEGYFAFEPITFTASSTTSPIAITLHGPYVTAQQVTDWAKLHPASPAHLFWRNGGTAAAMLSVALKNVNVVSVKDSGGAEVHLTALVDTVTGS